jgi:hypothetical protein
MENGGNGKVNAIFEARLPQSSAIKPTQIADGPTRERFIRDKYERRKYYDPAAYFQPTAVQQEIALPALAATTGPPSDAARQRMEERRGRIKKTSSTVSVESVDSSAGRGTRRVKKTGTAASSNRPKNPVAKAPASAPPPSMDLLDLMSDPAPNAPPTHAQSFVDSKSDMFDFMDANVNTNNSAAATDNSIPAGSGHGGGIPSGSGHGGARVRRERAAGRSAAPAARQSSASEDILSLYNTASVPQQQVQQRQSFQNNTNDPLGNHMSTLMQQMALGQTGNNNNGNNNNGNNGMMQQQQQQNMTPMQQQANMTMQQALMNPQQLVYQQQMMMMQQQQRQQMMMMQQQQGNNNNGNNINNMGMMNQQQGNQGMMNQNNNNMMMMQGQGMQQQNNGGGFGSPMGSGPPVSTMQSNNNNNNNNNKQSNGPKAPEKDDPFAQFGMNVFR